ncbi:MAG: hypothetical protein HY906_14985 [Deltaproteobacteria bacterium]|nr:hypothetical protein [Deltaproteobacteria bacterium]
MSEARAKPAPRSARAKVLMVIAAVIAAGLGYLAWSTQMPRDPAAPVPIAAPTSQPSRVRSPASRPALTPRRSPRASSRAPVVATMPTPDGGPPRAGLTKSDIRVAQANLHRAADPCVEDALKTNPNLGLRMAVRYTLYVQGGEARAVNPRITKSLLNDPQVERCILEKLTFARWKVDASDGVLHAAESFNFKHLQRTHIGD